VGWYWVPRYLSKSLVLRPLWPIVQTMMIDKDDFLSNWWNEIFGRWNRSTRRKPTPPPLCPPQNPTWQTWSRTPDRSGGKPATNRLSYGAASSITKSPKYSIYLRFSIKIMYVTSHLSYACYMYRKSLTPWFHHRNYMWWSFSLYFVHSPCTFSLVLPCILRFTMFWIIRSHPDYKRKASNMKALVSIFVLTFQQFTC
jgi:hypothetical protein